MRFILLNLALGRHCLVVLAVVVYPIAPVLEYFSRIDHALYVFASTVGTNEYAAGTATIPMGDIGLLDAAIVPFDSTPPFLLAGSIEIEHLVQGLFVVFVVPGGNRRVYFVGCSIIFGFAVQLFWLLPTLLVHIHQSTPYNASNPFCSPVADLKFDLIVQAVLHNKLCPLEHYCLPV